MNTEIPNIGAPAGRALANAGIADLADLSKQTQKEVAALHGMGPKSLRILHQALADAGLTFADEA